MKKIVMFMVPITVVSAVIVGTYMNIPSMSTDVRPVVENGEPAKSAIDAEPVPAIVDMASSDPQEINNEIFNDEISNSDIIGNEITAALSGDYSNKRNSSLEKIKEIFPELREEINQYQENIRVQKMQVSDYRARVAEYNREVKETGYTPDGLSFALSEDKDRLLAAAQELGRTGVKINEAIRQHAADWLQHN